MVLIQCYSYVTVYTKSNVAFYQCLAIVFVIILKHCQMTLSAAHIVEIILNCLMFIFK